ncbi:MAG TPA: TraR/DksA family transcriptional regulator [Pirellulaceae bacterium]|nr:TraR/DksA family transcriptional regulator [Pirellulaceae bacterium]HMO93885.1 TraR/DksA family transcriptional regulator [Pirellulaceae bacterium]HMP70894.1 TraR/DksA family transcriptional regulator [Pirellulaceae bacterium]
MASDEFLEIKLQLERQLAELENRAERIESRLSDPGNPDWEENAVLHANDEVLNALTDLTGHDIQEIRLALNKIEAGTYGVCSDCNRKISKQRLEALPFSSLCIDCANAHLGL